LPNYANSAHSLYLEALLSGGVVGGMLALGLFYTMFRRIRPVGGALFLLFVLILVAGVTETMFSLASFGIMNLFFAYAFSFSDLDNRV
jgi:O-antigen ligase